MDTGYVRDGRCGQDSDSPLRTTIPSSLDGLPDHVYSQQRPVHPLASLMRMYRDNHGDMRHTQHAGFCALSQVQTFSVTSYFLSVQMIYAFRLIIPLCNILGNTSRARSYESKQPVLLFRTKQDCEQLAMLIAHNPVFIRTMY